MPDFITVNLPSREEMNAAIAAAVEPLARKDELPAVPPPPDLTEILTALTQAQAQLAEALRKLSNQGGRIQKLENAAAARA